jgi:site-specific DNA-methyltransferase (adenine-specific)
VKTSPMPQLTSDRPGSGEEFIVIGHSGKRKLAWNGKGRAGVFRGPRDQDAFHPNQKPLWLMQELLGLFSQPGELVIDPFAGSATTGVAALFPERVHGLTSLDNVGCPKCAKALTQYMDGRPPLPSELRFVGIEADVKTLPVAEARLYAALKGQLYDPQESAGAG